MRTGLSREGEDDIDTHIITVPLSFRVEGDEIFMERLGNVRVVPAPGVRRNIPQQGIMRRNIEDCHLRSDYGHRIESGAAGQDHHAQRQRHPGD